ncbi:helix-turn-helix transcriptional regulator [Saccharopolyspora shandongensis]|uniref:helix-turn-helix transcriptional regulator n=1 Tax=Saccharopolyspora shandongensis TaxID=418495 RepID=UPI0033D82F29
MGEEESADSGWLLRLWAAADASDPTGVTRFHQHFTGQYGLVDGRLLLAIVAAADRGSDSAVRVAQRVINLVEQHLHVHVDELALDLVTMPEIAERAGLTRQAVSQYVNGRRGPGSFPTCLNPWSQIRLWDWNAVNRWLHRVGRGHPVTSLGRSDVSIVNGWLTAGYSLGQRASALVAPPPEEIRPPDLEAEQLAAAFLGAATDDQLERVVNLLNTVDDTSAFVEVLDAIGPIPIAKQQSWAHMKTLDRVVALLPELRRELDGSAARQRRRAALSREIADERYELEQGLYHPDQPSGVPKVAIEVLCAGNGGRCQKLRGHAYVQPGRLPGSPVLMLSNDGRRYGFPPLEGLVHSFEDSTDVFYSYRCGHNKYVRTDPERGKIRTEGLAARMPLRLLEPKLKAYWASRGKVQQLAWAPGVSETMYDPSAR